MNKKQIRNWLESKKKRQIKIIAKDLDIEFPKEVTKLSDMVEYLIDNVKHADLVDYKQEEPEKKSLFQKIKTKDGKERTAGETAMDWGKSGLKLAIAVGLGWALKSTVGSTNTVEGGDQEETDNAEDMTV